MKFIETALKGAVVIDPEPMEDERGLFARAFCEQEFADHGLEARFVQCNLSYNSRKGTLRGLHFQAPPHQEAKIVRCTRGAIFDVVVDLRTGSETLARWTGFELDESNRRAVYVPRGFAHGFITLVDGSEVLYMMSAPYVAEAARGIRWDDQEIAIDWPLVPTIISARDAALPRLRDVAAAPRGET